MTPKLILIFAILFIFISISSAGITSVVQDGKRITINYSPMTMLFFQEQLTKNGMKTSILPYCKALYGWSPLICNLPTVPSCDGIRLYGATGIGEDDDEDSKQKQLQQQQQIKSSSLFHCRVADDLMDSVGQTPLIKIQSLSDATGCTILGKAEFMNPGGSPKDRVAKSIILDAEKRGLLKPGVSTIVEATAGSTGISLVTFAKKRGYNVELYIPDNVSKEKIELLEMLGAKTNIVPIVGMNNANHFMHCAYQRCLVDENAFYANQFDNLSNFNAHFYGTAKEIWEQTSGGHIDAFICGAGTGGTIAGISNYLKSRNNLIETWLIDPPGSGLYNLVQNGVIFDVRDRLVVDKFGPRSFYEGVGVNRKTENFNKAVLNGAFKGSEMEGVEMAHHLLKQDGLFLGGSSALNCVGAVKLARKLGPVDFTTNNGWKKIIYNYQL
ncbi:cysteine synthase [Cavenderia fasciculata]|uniref:Cysteine synthase n=1 Tax=Cavenderia fasciculata TaxID=261658 RepID=F4QA68_CACFS|nr:cysteine synthase [Cavenderia fasciculata]EGG15587.1 cysteine synthase [Cavenderia fasciculata]|eukprot:XP_004354329.1 cysteine synthase [Cavenderia fasciculata]